jgi:hypothetical protein
MPVKNPFVIYISFLAIVGTLAIYQLGWSKPDARSVLAVPPLFRLDRRDVDVHVILRFNLIIARRLADLAVNMGEPGAHQHMLGTAHFGSAPGRDLDRAERLENCAHLRSAALSGL